MIQDPVKKQLMQGLIATLKNTDEQFAKITDLLAPTALDSQCKLTIEKIAKALETSAASVVNMAKTSGINSPVISELSDAYKRMMDALGNLLGVTELPDLKGAKESEDFTDSAQAIIQSAATLMTASGNPELIKQHTGEVKNAVTRLGQAGKIIISQITDPLQKERLANYLKTVVEGTKNLLEVVPSAINNPNDIGLQKKVTDAAQEIADITQQLIGDTGKQIAISALYNSAKLAAASTTKLCTSAKLADGKIDDIDGKTQLQESSKAAKEAIQKLVSVLKKTSLQDPKRFQRRTAYNKKMNDISSPLSSNEEIISAAEQFAPVAFKLVSASKSVSGKVNDEERKQDLIYSSSNAAKAIQKMLANRKAVKIVKGQLQTAEAFEEFKAAQADLDGAIIACDTGILQPTKEKDAALNELVLSIQELGNSVKQLAATAKTSPEDLGTAMKKCAASVNRTVAAATALAASINDKLLQKAILNNLKTVVKELKHLMQISKAVAANPEDVNINNSLMKSGKAVAEALVSLTEASKGVVPKKIEDFQEKSSSDIEDLAERELKNAATAIEKCVAKLNAATEAARKRAQEKVYLKFFFLIKINFFFCIYRILTLMNKILQKLFWKQHKQLQNQLVL